MSDAQSVQLGMTLLRLITREDERPAGLALISTLRKRLCSLPGELSADMMWRVRLRKVASAARNRMLSVAFCVLWHEPCSSQARVHAAGRLGWVRSLVLWPSLLTWGCSRR